MILMCDGCSMICPASDIYRSKINRDIYLCPTCKAIEDKVYIQ